MTSQVQGLELDTLIESFLETKCSPETIRAYKREITRFIDRLSLKPRTIEGFLLIPFPVMCDHVSTYINEHKKINVHTGHVLNPRSVNRKLYAVSAFFIYLTKKHDYPGNPTRILEPVPAPKKSSTPSPTDEVVQKLLSRLREYRNEGIRQFRNTILILTMFLLALRRSEAANLKWSDIDSQAQTLTIIQKGGTEKHLPIPPVLLSLLTDFRKASGLEFEYIFRDLRQPLDQPITGTTAYNIIREIIVGIFPESKLTPHSFRKGFIEQALNRKNDLISIANATGHASIEMIKYYDTRDAIKNNAINDVSDLLDW